MKKDNKALVLYILILFLILIVCLGVTLYVIPNFFQTSARIAYMIMWFAIAVIAIPIENDHTRFKGKKEKIKTTLIIVIIYNILYFLLGIFVGYQRNPLSMKFFSILKNLFFMVGLIALQDFVRSKLINNERKKMNYFIFTLAFILIRLDYSAGMQVFASGESIFEYVSSTIIPEIAKGCVCSYLAYTGGTFLVYAYSIPMALIQVIAPIFPDLDWFLKSVFDILISVILFLYNNYEHNIKTNRLTRKEKKQINPLKSIPSLALLLLSVSFIAGFLPIKPVAVMSYSMVPTFSRGAVIISQKVKADDANKLKIGDILHYKSENGDVIHRIVDIKENEDGKLIFQTKGDNNGTSDSNWVETGQIIGIVRIYIPYIGYPSVWFGEKVLGKKSFITI